MGEVPDCNTLLMRNHGFCTFGKSVAEAWVLAYNFERACGTLLRVLQTGAEVTGIRIGFVGLLKTEKSQSYCQMLKCTDCLIVSLSYE